MKVLVVLCVAILCLITLVALLPAHASPANMSDVALDSGEGALALATSRPDRPRYYKSYPAPTGLPGFRKYYQRRCYPGCHYGYNVVTPTPQTETHAVPSVEPTRTRYYKSYPAPTGQPAFRKYYQRRCYPGCHYGGTVITPSPGIVHP
jgi:hypothetical protein